MLPDYIKQTFKLWMSLIQGCVILALSGNLIVRAAGLKICLSAVRFCPRPPIKSSSDILWAFFTSAGYAGLYRMVNLVTLIGWWSAKFQRTVSQNSLTLDSRWSIGKGLGRVVSHPVLSVHHNSFKHWQCQEAQVWRKSWNLKYSNAA